MCSWFNSNQGHFYSINSQKANIHAEDDRALRYAAAGSINYSNTEVDHLNVVRFLVESGADIHAKNDQAFRSAAWNGHLDITKLMVELGADIHANNNEAFCSAIRDGRLYIAKFLVESGADYKKEEVLHALSIDKFPETAEELISIINVRIVNEL